MRNLAFVPSKVPGTIHFLIADDGTVTFMPVKSDVRELKGILSKPKQPVSVEAMNAAIAEGGSGR